MKRPLRACHVAAMLRTTVFDLEDAAAFLAIEPETLTMQVYRRRIASVRYGNGRYFALGDLVDYRQDRDRGRLSNLVPKRSILVRRIGANRVQSNA